MPETAHHIPKPGKHQPRIGILLAERGFALVVFDVGRSLAIAMPPDMSLNAARKRATVLAELTGATFVSDTPTSVAELLRMERLPNPVKPDPRLN